MCTRNDHTVQAGEPGRTLANGDLLRIETVTPGGLVVRRALDADPATGQRQWTDRTFLYQHFSEAELGYAVTDHVAQSRTVTAGLAVIADTEDRQHAYVGLSRGTDTNMAYVFTMSPKLADLVPGPRPAPELARYERIAAGHDGQPAAAAAENGDALAVLAGVLGRDGQQFSASQARQQARQVRAAAREARLSGLRASAEAAAAVNHGDPGTAARQQQLATSYHALHQAYRQRETLFDTIMADRADWDAAPGAT